VSRRNGREGEDNGHTCQADSRADTLAAIVGLIAGLRPCRRPGEADEGEEGGLDFFLLSALTGGSVSAVVLPGSASPALR
jgi:hypothetical protein